MIFFFRVDWETQSLHILCDDVAIHLEQIEIDCEAEVAPATKKFFIKMWISHFAAHRNQGNIRLECALALFFSVKCENTFI